VTTREVVEKVIALWGCGSYVAGTAQSEVETALLRVNWDKAANRLGWHSVYDWETALAETVAWYKTYAERAARGRAVDMYDVCVGQIQRYTARASALDLDWTR